MKFKANYRFLSILCFLLPCVHQNEGISKESLINFFCMSTFQCPIGFSVLHSGDLPQRSKQKDWECFPNPVHQFQPPANRVVRDPAVSQSHRSDEDLGVGKGSVQYYAPDVPTLTFVSHIYWGDFNHHVLNYIFCCCWLCCYCLLFLLFC